MPDTRKTVFLLDDSEIALAVARQSLETAGFRVIAANNLAEFEERQAGISPDLVLLDVQMPELFGDDVGFVLRGVRGVTAPVYLFSSLDEEELERRVLAAELDGYMCKSAGIEAMVDRVRTILGT